jgi:SAM-dependent methyltransferase
MSGARNTAAPAPTASYYAERLSAARLKQCYDIAPPRVKQYMEAELDYAARRIKPGDTVLELGCGYGRILPRVTERAAKVTGIDNSLASLLFAKEALRDLPNCSLALMDAVRLGFTDASFDCVLCIQNGISAFHVDQRELIEESIRVTKGGGTILFSSYSDKFWKHRLEWFELQSRAGLLGEIDYTKTGGGVIVCKDGFTATTVGPDAFRELTAGLDVDIEIAEVGESSVFCDITPPGQSAVAC